MNTYSLAGSVLGLKYNANTGQFWVVQGQYSYSQLSVIDPASKSISSYAFQQSSLAASVTGFNAVAFTGNNVFMAGTPNVPFLSGFSSFVAKLDNPNPISPVTFTNILTGPPPNYLGPSPTAVVPPFFLNSTPSGGLILSGSYDPTLTFVSNPGQASQTATTLNLLATPGSTIGFPGDALYATASSGTFYLGDRATNTIEAVSARGLDPDTLFVTVGNEFGTVDTTTGVVTPILSGGDFQAMTFVPSADTAAPEPGTMAVTAAGFLGLLFTLRRKH